MANMDLLDSNCVMFLRGGPPNRGEGCVFIGYQGRLMGCIKSVIFFALLSATNVSRLGRLRGVATCVIRFRYFVKCPAYLLVLF